MFLKIIILSYCAFLRAAAHTPFSFPRAPLAMAGKKRKPELESDPSSSNSESSEFDEDGSEEGAAAGGGMDETEEDDELEAEMAALAAIRSEKRGGGAGKDKVRINNKPGLTASLEGTFTPFPCSVQ
jgi:hypothetical protein